MPLTEPLLDDRTFDQIVDEAKTLIPRYAPEWTDHNASDPGITLLELFAWMTELTLFRLNQVPALNYVKFLKLLGIELEPARPARAELTFTLTDDTVDAVAIPAGAQVGVSGGGGPPVVFETDRALNAIGAHIDAIQVDEGASVSVVGPTESGETFLPFGRRARDGSSLMIGFGTANAAFTKEAVDLLVEASADAVPLEGRSCDSDLQLLPPPAKTVWELWNGLEWQVADVERDETRAFTRSGHVVLKRPATATMPKAALGASTDELFWVRCRLVEGHYERAPELEAVLTNTVPATAALTVRDEVLGGTDGRVGQTFTLASAPVVPLDEPLYVPVRPGATEKATVTSLWLEIDQGLGFEVWEEVGDFFGSGPDSQHYVLDRTTGRIRFGDGDRGAIPRANLDNPEANVVARRYRYGGGARTNAAPGAVSDPQIVPAEVASVTNHRAATGGVDEETLEHAKQRAPQELKSKGRAVTADDFELLAREAPGASVKRAKALPLVHPKFRDDLVPGVVTVIVVPEGDAPNPLPNEATLSAVCVYLNQHRLLTSEVHVTPPRYHQVKIEADVSVLPSADLGATKRAIEQRLVDWLHPLTGGDDGQGWPFGGDLYYSDVYRRILETEGVDRIENNRLWIWLDNWRHESCEDVAIANGELVYSVDHEIRVEYGARS